MISIPTAIFVTPYKCIRCFLKITDQTEVKMATIMDLDERCLTEIFQYLNKFDLFALRQTNDRFIEPTERCFKNNFADEFFDVSEWHTYTDSDSDSEASIPTRLEEVIEYFGRFIKNVLFDEKFNESVNNKLVSVSFLSKNMPHVQCITTGYSIEKEDIDLISMWREVKELNTFNDFENFGSFHWPHLTTLCANSSVEHLNIIAFLKSHKNLKKLHLKQGSNEKRDDLIIETIVNDLSNLIDLDISGLEPNLNTSMIFRLSNLESLVIEVPENVEPFKNLTNLKRLEVPNDISVQTLYNLVEFVPTMCCIKLSEIDSTFDREVADGLVARRMKSPYCEKEKLEISGHIDSMTYVFGNEFVAHLDSKYVSCDYYVCSSPEQVLQHVMDNLMNRVEEMAPFIQRLCS